ncbi:biopolymer transport protein ExbD [bacterium BMS3Bbin04]|nr:biopolymer transport protein ExbD [bacterium BMS3Bbin04]
MKFSSFHSSDDLQQMPEINVVPLIDVFLVLLVIFMITAPVIKTAIEMGLPSAQTATADPSQGITVKILPDGTVWIDDERVSIRAFPERFRDIYSNTGPGGNFRPVFLAAGEEVPYGDVVTILDELRVAGVEDLGLLTQKE